jgi:hypothetical protein
MSAAEAAPNPLTLNVITDAIAQPRCRFIEDLPTTTR